MTQVKHDRITECDEDVLATKFQYHPLPDAVTWIRLLRVKGMTTEGHLDCDLLLWNLDQKVEFHAISYTWGEYLPRARLRLNSQHWLDTRPNCVQALRQVLVHQGPGTLVWIDAVCINQAEIDEKSCQVSIMAEIYAKAVNVFACVGSHANDSRMLFDLLNRDSGRGVQLHLSSHRSHEWSRMEKFRLRAWLLSHRLEYTKRLADALFAFLSRVYFSRVWVVQELFCSQDTFFLCGTDSVNCKLVYALRDIVCFAPLLLFESSLPMDGSPVGFPGLLGQFLNRGLKHIYLLRRMQAYHIHDSGTRSIGYLCMEASQKGDLVGNLHITVKDMMELDCEDPRDRLFAASAITPAWPGWKDVRPDYRMSPEDLAVKVLQADALDTSSIRRNDFEKCLVGALGLAANDLGRILLAFQEHSLSSSLTDPYSIKNDELIWMSGLSIRQDKSVPVKLPHRDTRVEYGIDEVVFQQDPTSDMIDGYVRLLTRDRSAAWTLILPATYRNGDMIFVDQRSSSWTFGFLGRSYDSSETFRVIDCCLLSHIDQPHWFVAPLFRVRGLSYIQKLGLEILQAGAIAQQNVITDLEAVSLLNETKRLLLDLSLERLNLR